MAGKSRVAGKSAEQPDGPLETEAAGGRARPADGSGSSSSLREKPIFAGRKISSRAARKTICFFSFAVCGVSGCSEKTVSHIYTQHIIKISRQYLLIASNSQTVLVDKTLLVLHSYTVVFLHSCSYQLHSQHSNMHLPF